MLCRLPCDEYHPCRTWAQDVLHSPALRPGDDERKFRHAKKARRCTCMQQILQAQPMPCTCQQMKSRLPALNGHADGMSVQEAADPHLWDAGMPPPSALSGSRALLRNRVAVLIQLLLLRNLALLPWQTISHQHVHTHRLHPIRTVGKAGNKPRTNRATRVFLCVALRKYLSACERRRRSS